MSFDLFICHSSADAETASLLVKDFESRGINCWIAPRNIPMGSSYQGEIVSSIERCRAVLLLFSGAANNSEHVLREVELAAQSRKPIYPLRIDAAEPAGGLRYMLANKQWVERKALGNRLVETVEQLLGGAASASPPPQPAKARVSPAAIASAAVAVCLAIAAGMFALQGGWPWPPKVGIDKAGIDRAGPEKTAPVAATPPPAGGDGRRARRADCRERRHRRQPITNRAADPSRQDRPRLLPRRTGSRRVFPPARRCRSRSRRAGRRF